MQTPHFVFLLLVAYVHGCCIVQREREGKKITGREREGVSGCCPNKATMGYRTLCWLNWMHCCMAWAKGMSLDVAD